MMKIEVLFGRSMAYSMLDRLSDALDDIEKCMSIDGDLPVLHE